VQLRVRRAVPVLRQMKLWLAVLLTASLTSSLARAKPPELVRLTEAHLVAFVAAAEASAAFEVRQNAEWLRFGKSNTSNSKVVADFQRAVADQRDVFAKANGFTSGDEYLDVEYTIAIILSSTDPATGKWTGDPLAVAMHERVLADLQDPQNKTYRKQSPSVRADAIAQKRQALEALKSPRFPENMPLVQAHREKIVGAIAAQKARVDVLTKAQTAPPQAPQPTSPQLQTPQPQTPQVPPK
jgi:hypothetical protein